MIEVKVLKNGIKYLSLAEEKNLGDFSFVSFAWKIGSFFETEKNNGISHLLEHLLISSPKKNAPEGSYQFFKKTGIDFNAQSLKDYNFYFFAIPNSQFKKFVDFLPDFLTLNFDQKRLDLEKKIIIEEIEDSERDDRYQLFQNLKNKKIFEENSLSLSIFGNGKVISKITLEEIKQFYDNNFATNKIAFSCLGKEKNRKKLEQKLLTIFDSGKINKDLKDEKIFEIAKNNDFGIKNPNFERPCFGYSFIAKKILNPEKILLAILMRNYFYHILFRKLREENALTYDLQTDFYQYYPDNIAVLDIRTNCHPKNLSEIKKYCEDLFREKKINQEIFESIKKEVAKLFWDLDVEETMQEMNARLLYELPIAKLEQYSEILEKIDYKDFQTFYDKEFSKWTKFSITVSK